MITRRALCLAAAPALAQLRLPALRKRPYLLIDETGLPALRERLSRDPSRKVYENYTRPARQGAGSAVEPLILLALMEGDRKVMEAAGAAFVRSFRASKGIGEKVLNSSGPYDFSTLRYIHRLLNQFDFVDSFSVLGSEDRKEFRDYIFWAVGKFMTAPIRDLNARPEHRRHNFHTDNITTIGTAALVFPEHPGARQWLEYTIADFTWQMQNSVTDGAWWETPRYHGAVLRSLIPLAHAIKRNAGVDLFANGGLRGMLDWLVRCQTPRDRVYGAWLKQGRQVGVNGSDTMAFLPDAVCESPGVGDAEWANYWFANLAMAAPQYKERDPGFAARLMWGWHRAGGPYAPESNLLIAPLILIDPTIPPAPQTLGSESTPGVGYAILRAGYDKPGEKYLFFLSGKSRFEAGAGGHKHRDQNSFSLLAEGVPLALDAGSGLYRTPEHDQWHRATVSHNTVLFGGANQEREDGRIVKFQTTPDADYVAGDASAPSRCARFLRHIVFVKPDYFVIWDSIRAEVPAEWLLHSPAREIRRADRALEFVTPWEASLDVHFLLPDGSLEVWEGEGRFSAWRTPEDRGVPPFPFQKYVKVKNEAGRDFLTVLHPRRAGAPKLAARLIPGAVSLVEVQSGGRTDCLLLSDEPREFSDKQRRIVFNGRVGLLRGPKAVLLDAALLRRESL